MKTKELLNLVHLHSGKTIMGIQHNSMDDTLGEGKK